MIKELSKFKVINKEGKEYIVIVTQEINTANIQMGMMAIPGESKMKPLKKITS
jgi:hypothetical protein